MRSEEAWIEMPDGVRLAATLYLPDQGDGPWPAVLEYLPYRKDDWTLRRDLTLYPYLADRGYVGARVDIRGTGRSQGRLPDGEYSERELEEWAGRIDGWRGDGVDVYAYFNNDWEGYAVRNGRSLRERLGV